MRMAICISITYNIGGHGFTKKRQNSLKLLRVMIILIDPLSLLD